MASVSRALDFSLQVQEKVANGMSLREALIEFFKSNPASAVVGGNVLYFDDGSRAVWVREIATGQFAPNLRDLITV